MARPLRPLVAGGVYHVMARGNEKALIYLGEHDRLAFLEILGRTVSRFGWLCQSYCLMGNHFHLLLQTPEPNLPRGAQQLKSSYAQWFNKRHGRTGHLFGGRYKAILIQQDAHLLEVFRYIALNPVRGGLCNDPRAWEWSAHGALAGHAAAPKFLAVRRARAWFDSASEYERFVAGPASLEYEPTGVVFGDADFKRSVLPEEAPDAEISERDWGEGRPSLGQIFGRTPGPAGIAAAYRQYGYGLAPIAAQLGCHVSTVSRRLRRYEHEVLENKI